MIVMTTLEQIVTSTGLMPDRGGRARALFVEAIKKLLIFIVKLMKFLKRK